MIRTLVERYEKEWAESQGRPLLACAARPTNPLLLDVPTAYFDADHKVMVFGQETNNWENAFPHEGGVSHMLQTYREFYNEGYCYSPYGGQWWNGIKDFKKQNARTLSAFGEVHASAMEQPY